MMSLRRTGGRTAVLFRQNVALLLRDPAPIVLTTAMPLILIAFLKGTGAAEVAALRQCRVLAMPSPYESLSVIVLEAWKLGVPVLANARCKVLAGQCLSSNGGLFYHGYAEFAEGLRLLLGQDDLAASLGRQGQAYVEREYSWETIDGKIDELLARTTAPSD